MMIQKLNKWREFPGGLVLGFWAFSAGAWVQPLVGKLRFCKLHGKAPPPQKLNKWTWNLEEVSGWNI